MTDRRKLTTPEWGMIPLAYRLQQLERLLERRRRDDKTALQALDAASRLPRGMDASVLGLALEIASDRDLYEAWREAMELGECESCSDEPYDGCPWHAEIAVAERCVCGESPRWHDSLPRAKTPPKNGCTGYRKRPAKEGA